MDFTRERVSLADIRPSKENPRSDFGDIAALADSIRATGNEPVNPPVVVRDGNVYRIVDGERRYRALKEVWRLDVYHEVTVLVAGDLDAANELVAMVATDDKLRLSDAERARGVQQMLILGVDEERVSRASRASAKQVRAAKRLAGRVQEGWQVTLDQLAAADALDSEEDREAVLSAGDNWRWKEQSIRARIDQERKAAKKLEWLADAGIPVQAGGDAPDGMEHVANVFSYEPLSRVKEAAKGLDGSCLAIMRDGSIQFLAPEGHPVLEAEEDPRAAEAAREHAAAESLGMRLFRFVLADAFACGVELDERVRTARSNGPLIRPPFEDSELDELACQIDSFRASQPVGRYEVGQYLLQHAERVARGFMPRWSGEPSPIEAGRLLAAIEAFRLAGFGAFDEGDAWLEERAREAAGETGERG